MDTLEYLFVSKENKGPYHRLFVELAGISNYFYFIFFFHFHQIFYLISCTDPRVKNFPLMNSPIWILGILIVYWIFITLLGPKIMSKRKPMDLKYTIMIYNFLHILVSSYICYDALWPLNHPNYKWYCEEMDYSDNPRAVRLLKAIYFYTLMKLVELSDTVFFVLRKKFNQVTVLHIYHHSVMAFTSWATTLYFGGGMWFFGVSLNSFVHVIMYGYYLLASFGPGVQKYLWWKKYLTLIQIVSLNFCFL